MFLRSMLIALSLSSAAPGPATAQENDAAALLERAELQENARGDLAAAARTYERVIQLVPTGELATRAQLRLGLIWMQTGREAAARAALERAARGQGPSAERAKELLAGAPIGSQDRLAQQVTALLQQIRDLPGGLDTEIPGVVIESFEILGRDAVPFLIRAFEEENDLVFIGRAFAILKSLGGERAAEYFGEVASSEDVVRRRLAVTSGAAGIDASVVPALKRFLKDPDEQTAVRALRLLEDDLGPREIIELIDPTRLQVSEAVLALLSLPKHRPAFWDEVPDAVRAAIHRLRGAEISEDLAHQIAGILADRWWTRSVAGSSLYLEALTWPELARLENWRSQDGPRSEAVPAADLVLEIARELESATFSGAEGSREALHRFLLSAQRQWGPAAEDEALALIRLGYGHFLWPWIVQHLPQVPFAILSEVSTQLENPTDFLNQMNQSGWTPTIDEVPAVVDWIQTEQAEPQAQPQRRQWKIGFALRALAQSQTAAGARALVDIAADQPELYNDVVFQLAHHASDQTLFAFRLLLPLKGQDHYRNLAFAYTLRAAEPEGIEALIRSYEFGLSPAGDYGGLVVAALGLSQSSTIFRLPRKQTSPQGLFWFVVTGSDGPVARYGDDATRRIVEGCLEGPAPAAWKDIEAAFQAVDSPLYDDHTLERVPDGFLQAVANRVRSSPAGELRRNIAWFLLRDDRLGKDQHLEILRWALNSQEPDLIQVGMNHLPEEASAVSRLELMRPLLRWLATSHGYFGGAIDEVVRDGITYVVQPDQVPQEAVDLVTRIVGEGMSNLRDEALRALIRQLPEERFVELVPQMLENDTSEVRSATVRFLATYHWRHEDPDVLDYLIQALQDPSRRVRVDAKQHLDGLRQYRETVQFWKNVQAGTSLSSESAAEALIEQAKDETSSLEVRVAAIRSLGSLAVPETLPILIEWLKSDVPEIKKAAAEAIARINE